MPRLTALPSFDIIHGFKGILDFYLWKGIPCCRKWPYNPKSHHSEATKAAAAIFGAVLKGYALLADTALEAFREDAKDQPRSSRDIYVSAIYGNLHQRTIPPPPPEVEEMYDAYVCLRDVKPQATTGGTFTASAWQTRDLNDEQADTKDICTLAANQFTLPAGTYRCLISAPALMVTGHQARLYSVTDATMLLLGTCEYTVAGTPVTTRSFIVGRFTLDAEKTLEVQHRCGATYATSGFGHANNFNDEIYTLAEFWRETP